MKKKRLCLAVATVVLLASVACGLSSGAGDYQALVDLNDEFLEFRRPAMTNGLPDYRNETIESQRAGLESFAQRLQAIDPTSWPVSQQVDYLLVRRRSIDSISIIERDDAGLVIRACTSTPCSGWRSRSFRSKGKSSPSWRRSWAAFPLSWRRPKTTSPTVRVS